MVIMKQTLVVNMGGKCFCLCLGQCLMCTTCDVLAVWLCRWTLPFGAFSPKNWHATLQIHTSAAGLERERKGLFYTELHNVVSGCHHFQHIWPTQFPVLNQLSFHQVPSSHFCWFGWALQAIYFNSVVWKSPSLEKNRSSLGRMLRA